MSLGLTQPISDTAGGVISPKAHELLAEAEKHRTWTKSLIKWVFCWEGVYWILSNPQTVSTADGPLQQESSLLLAWGPILSWCKCLFSKRRALRIGWGQVSPLWIQESWQGCKRTLPCNSTEIDLRGHCLLRLIGPFGVENCFVE